jgi:molybdate transport repressor ModE-like protein
MTQIIVRPQWIVESEDGARLPPILFPLLEAIQATEKLTTAARQLGISYRHAWNLIEHCHRFFGTPLVALQRGQGAQLTLLGEKLVWAERRTRARLGPHIESLASEINHELSRLLSTSPAALRVHASHGFAVAKLPELMANEMQVQVDLRFMGSVEALASLQNHNCEFAGFHLATGELGAELIGQYGTLMNSDAHLFIHLVRRVQGLYVAKGNPKGIHTLSDLRHKNIRMINRQTGSGTRILLDHLLQRAGIDGDDIQGYRSEEFTHAAVAAYVASGIADVGFGVEPPARQFGMDFIPIADEIYYLACDVQTLKEPSGARLHALLSGSAFRTMARQLPGYNASLAGNVLTAAEIKRSLRA